MNDLPEGPPEPPRKKPIKKNSKTNQKKDPKKPRPLLEPKGPENRFEFVPLVPTPDDAAKALRRAALLEEFFQSEPRALIVITPDCEVLNSNVAAKRQLASGSVVANKAGYLETIEPKNEPVFLQFIRTARDLNGAKTYTALAMPKGEIWALEARQLPATTFMPAPLAIALRPAGYALDGCLQAATVALGLTRMEAEVVADMIAGLSTRESAEKLEIAYETVRSHTKRIFKKTGTNHSGELIALVTTYLV
jgi:DNA-binding CsgD family transcriptional regulator